MGLIPVLISCVMFVIIVVTLVRIWGQRLPDDVRVIDDPIAAGLLDIRETAELLDTTTRELLEMVRRDAIPFYRRGARQPLEPERLLVSALRDRRVGDRLASGSSGRSRARGRGPRSRRSRRARR